MANLSTKYMGIELKNPLVVGASSVTGNMESIKKIEDAGAGAMVIKSLFEEEIQLERHKLDKDLEMYDDWHAEMTNIFPELEHAGPDDHLMWTRKAKEAVSIPVIASLNAVQHDTWVEWAAKLEETGVDGLELNFFSVPTDPAKSAKEIEEEQIAALTAVKKKVKIPVSVKLSAFYTSPLEMVHRMDKVGVDGYVLFNRMFHPSFDIEKETARFPFNLSTSSDHRLALRYVGLLAGEVKGSLCGSNGIHTAEDAIELLLAGADSFQVVSALYRNSVKHVGTIISGIESWMDKKGYASIDDFRAKLSVKNSGDKWSYRRAQYVKMLLRADDYVTQPKLI